MHVQRAEQIATRSTPKTRQRPASAGREANAAYAQLAAQCRARVADLAPRQRDVLTGVAAGRSNKQIAHTLGLSPRTVEIYRAGMMTRLNVRTLAQAMQIAFVAGLVPLDLLSS